jgi:hypothetical protein
MAASGGGDVGVAAVPQATISREMRATRVGNQCFHICLFRERIAVSSPPFALYVSFSSLCDYNLMLISYSNLTILSRK